MAKKENVPSGYLDRKEAAQLLGLSATMFDRIAPREFKHSRIRVGKGNAFYYSKDEIQAYRDFREKRRQANLEELTWQQLVARNEELTAQVADTSSCAKVFLWVLWPYFPMGKEVNSSAVRLEEEMPEKYQMAKQVLARHGLDIEELKERMACGLGKTNETTPDVIE
jgi:hypothetical protein